MPRFKGSGKKAKKLSITVKGVKEVKSTADRMMQAATRGIREGLLIWGQETVTLSKEQYTPVKKGILRGTGVAELKNERGNPIVELSFGGSSPADSYAIPVHEIDARHKVGQSKYLETPALREASRLPKVIRRRADARMRKVSK